MEQEGTLAHSSLWIGLYDIQSIKQVNVKAELMNKYLFDLRSYNL